jgi:hypothetical protein
MINMKRILSYTKTSKQYTLIHGEKYLLLETVITAKNKSSTENSCSCPNYEIFLTFIMNWNKQIIKRSFPDVKVHGKTKTHRQLFPDISNYFYFRRATGTTDTPTEENII